VEFRNENLLTTSMDDATVVYLACTCWDAPFMRQVLHKLAALPALTWVVTTESLEHEYQLDERWLLLAKRIELPMSWDDQWAVYVYTRVRGDDQ
jgi:hypothetical protein